ncbi:MAG: CPBP family intramembrane metalloprotease [Duncaniella sp.]|nr:CPBP family intramembrane metalloprotease [Muribaculum sp.]MCM1255577.1 CPBP family intramembrane metalloprotease [Duncaniella sp.]
MNNYSAEYGLSKGFSQRLLLFFGVTLLCLIVVSMIMSIVTSGGITTLSLRIGTVIQDVLLFVLPAVMTAVLVSVSPQSFLGFSNGVKIVQFLLVYLMLCVSLPGMNALVAWNEGLSLPENMGAVEEWMRTSEDAARKSVEILLGGTSVGDLVVSLLIVAVLAGFSEEIFFRGALQRLLASGPLNRHVAIWLAAFIFSAFHAQFYGFFPRMLLGAYFGYLLLWSRSLWLPVFAHILNNGVVVYSSWLSRRAGNAEVSESASGWVETIGIGSWWMITLSIILSGVCLVAIWRLSQSPSDEVSVHHCG